MEAGDGDGQGRLSKLRALTERLRAAGPAPPPAEEEELTGIDAALACAEALAERFDREVTPHLERLKAQWGRP